MPCPLCGDICRCSTDANSVAFPHAEPETPGADTPNLHAAAEGPLPDAGSESAPEDSPAWRQEVAARLNRYQARRKPRPPRYPSFRLRFEEEEPARTGSDISVEPSAFQHRATTASNQALALDGFAEALDAPVPDEPPQFAAPVTAPATAAPTAKIIEFPRSWTPPQAPLDELAEPVFDRDRPRILEAPEVVPPLRLWGESQSILPAGRRSRSVPASTSRCRV